MRKYLQNSFGIDTRSLALFRIGLGILLLCDLFNRLPDLAAHYSDAGVFPRAIDGAGGGLYLLSGSTDWARCLFALSAISALCLLFGFFTRFANICSWLLLLWLHNRNPLLLQGGDVLLRLLLFWGMFLPLGAVWSLDARKSWEPPSLILKPSSAALVLQVAYVYWFTVLLKTGPEWRSEGTAIYYALSNDQFATSLGTLLLQHPQLLKPLTHAVFWFEALGPCLFFMPFFGSFFRMLAAIGFVLLHLGLGLSLELGLFPWINIVSMLIFIPSSFWLLRGQMRSFTGFPTSIQKKLHGALGEILACICFIYVTLWNIESVSNLRLIPNSLYVFGAMLHLEQEWAMFAPAPSTDDGWYVSVGLTADKSEFDVLQSYFHSPQIEKPVWDRPKDIAASFHNQRWRKYLRILRLPEYQKQLVRLGGFLCHWWNNIESAEMQLQTIQIYFMSERTLPDFAKPSITKELLWEGNCL